MARGRAAMARESVALMKEPLRNLDVLPLFLRCDNFMLIKVVTT